MAANVVGTGEAAADSYWVEEDGDLAGVVGVVDGAAEMLLIKPRRWVVLWMWEKLQRCWVLLLARWRRRLKMDNWWRRLMLDAWQWGRLGGLGLARWLAQMNVACDRQIGMMGSTRHQTIRRRRRRRLVSRADRRVVASAKAACSSHQAAPVSTPTGVFGERREGVEGGRLFWYFWTFGGGAAMDVHWRQNVSLFEACDGAVGPCPRVPGCVHRVCHGVMPHGRVVNVRGRKNVGIADPIMQFRIGEISATGMEHSGGDAMCSAAGEGHVHKKLGEHGRWWGGKIWRRSGVTMLLTG